MIRLKENAMQSEVHRNLVLYRGMPQAGTRYRQIAVVEHGQFGVYVFEGPVIQTDPQFIVESSDAEVYFHRDMESAMRDAEKEFNDSVRNGWTPYTGGML